MKYFLTGWSGFVGSYLLDRLLEEDNDVVIDMRYLHTQKYDAVIHLAAKTNIGCDFDPDLIESNIVLTREIFKCNTRIVFGSSCSSEFLTNPYSYTKRYGEHLCNIHGNAVSLRFFNIYGRRANRGIVKFLMDQPDGSKITIRGVDQLRDYIHISDVIDEIMIALGYNDAKGIIEVGTGIATSTMDLCNLYMKLSGKTFDISVAEPHPSEPKEMVSNNPIMCMDLETGLLKTINQSK